MTTALNGLFFSCVYLWSHGLQYARHPCPSPTPGACSNSCPSIRWCHPTISSSVIPFFSCLQSLPASGSFLMHWLFSSGGQRTGASASVFPMNIQGWYPLVGSALICLQSKGLSRVFSNTTVQLNWKMTNASFPLKYGLFFNIYGRKYGNPMKVTSFSVHRTLKTKIFKWIF